MRTTFFMVMKYILTVLYCLVALIYLGIFIFSFMRDSSAYHLGEILFYILILIISGAVTLAPWYALASLSADYDSLVAEQTRLRREFNFYFQNQVEQQPSALNYSYSNNAVHTNNPANSTTTNLKDNKWLCKICGELNPNSSRTCKGCGNQK